MNTPMPDDMNPTIEELQTQIAADPANARAHMKLGAKLIDEGLLEGGYQVYLEAVKYLALNMEAERGSESYQRSLADSVFARYMIARVLEQMGRTEEARPHWETCLTHLRTWMPAEYLHNHPIYIEALAKIDDNTSP